ncbi:MAG TPA: HD domain-containing protein, partial [Bryobacteraceae bacterium]|nr:HD domain-containing protein [Bryobacteraceae bacterium]
LQHEIDHLNGTLYIDRMDSRTFMSTETYQARMIPWRQSLRAFMQREARPVEKLSHMVRLYGLTREIGAGLEYDDDIVFAAAWLHDLGVFEGHRPTNPEELAAWDNVAYAARQAPGILVRFGFPEAKIEAVVEAIRTHQATANPSAIEGTILRDADILEQLGAVGAMRTICKIGRDTRYREFGDAVASLRKALETLPQMIRLEPARELAAPRIEALRGFIEAAERELA